MALFLVSLDLLVVFEVICDGTIGSSSGVVLDPGIEQGHGLRVISANLTLIFGLIFFGHEPWTMDEMCRQMLQFRTPKPNIVAISVIVFALLDDVEMSEAFTRIATNASD